MKKYFLAGILVFFTMIYAGLTDNMKGIFIPSFKESFSISDSKVSIILLAASVGYIVCQYIGGVLVEKIGHRKTYYVAFILGIIGIGIIYFSTGFYVLVLAILLITMSLSMGVLCTNSLIPYIFLTSQAAFMGMVHFSYGVGGTIGQTSAGVLLDSGFNFRQIYLICGALALVMLVMAIFSKFPVVEKVEKEKKLISLKEVLSDKIVILFSLTLGFYVLAEAIVGTWFINYLKNVYSYTEYKGSYFISTFFLLFAIGRFCGGFIAEKLGYFKTVIAFMFLALIFVCVGLIGGEKFIFLVAISGLFFSLVYPVLITAISKRFNRNRAYILGVILTITALIGNGMNFLIGYINDLIGVYSAFYIVPISLAISLISCVYLSKSLKNSISKL